jgi:hypothetical protein
MKSPFGEFGSVILRNELRTNKRGLRSGALYYDWERVLVRVKISKRARRLALRLYVAT